MAREWSLLRLASSGRNRSLDRQVDTIGVRFQGDPRKVSGGNGCQIIDFDQLTISGRRVQPRSFRAPRTREGLLARSSRDVRKGWCEGASAEICEEEKGEDWVKLAEEDIVIELF